MFWSEEIKGLEADLSALFNELKYQRSCRGDHESVHKVPRRVPMWAKVRGLDYVLRAPGSQGV